MYDSSRIKPLGESAFFADGSSARRPPADTVPREAAAALDTGATGRENGAIVTTIPVAVTPALLARGRERFDIFCSPCHGRAGDGNGMIPQRGFQHPPSYHTDRLRTAPDGHIFDVITNGFGAMRSFSDRVAPADRWAIVAYVRALQLSQATPAALLSPDEMRRVSAPPPTPVPGAPKNVAGPGQPADAEGRR